MIRPSAAVLIKSAALLAFMGFTYTFCNPPLNQIDPIRLLVSDTVQNDPNGNRIYAFEDSEILAAYTIEGAVWMSPQFYSGQMGQQNEQTPPVSYRRVAATLVDALACNAARLNILSQVLDAKLNPGATKDMMAFAQSLRDVEDNNGAFVIIEQVNDEWSFRDRFWKTIQRQVGAF